MLRRFGCELGTGSRSETVMENPCYYATENGWMFLKLYATMSPCDSLTESRYLKKIPYELAFACWWK